MPATPTYSPVRYTPATVGTTHRHSRYAETHPVQPLKGLRETRAASVSYRASVPAGHDGCGFALSYRALSPYGEPQPVPTKALLNRSSVPTQFLSDWHYVSTTAPPFRHTPYRFWPRHATPVWRNLLQHPRGDDSFTFSAKERDSETGLSYFGSRYYSSDLSIWLSVDPQSDKYPSLSPYTYCANNPVKLVDPNGEDFETEIDYDNYTITIKATFYTANSNRKELEKGIALWKEQSGKYAYSIGEGDSRTDFTIIFDLNIAEGDFETDDDALSAMSTMQSNNFFSVRDNVYDEKGEEVRGECIGGNIIYVSNKYKNNRTAAHEIGHALGCGHAFESDDLMKTGGYGSNIGIKNIRAIMFFAGFDNSGIANVGNGRNGKSCDRLQLNDGCFWGNVIKKK